MKKLLLTIAIACMGCSESNDCAETFLGPNPNCQGEGNFIDCGWFEEFNECTCRCESIFQNEETTTNNCTSLYGVQ